jgi:ABC-type ATPase involved in cell division
MRQSDLLNLGVRIISDDPFSSADVLVTLQIGDSSTPIGGPGTPVLMSAHDEVAVIDKSTRKVVAMAGGYWY